MKEFIGVQVVCEDEVKFKGENVGLRLELAWTTSYRIPIYYDYL